MVAPKEKRPLVIRDEIHGDILFDAVQEKAINHPHVQRLRSIKQLGLADYVFPCASHTRFQHSLGCSHLAAQYFESLMTNWSSTSLTDDLSDGTTTVLVGKTVRVVREVDADPDSRHFWKRVVTMAALLHDVGHGPLSHTFENLPLRPDVTEKITQLPKVLQNYFERKLPKRLPHEDLSLIYLHDIVKDMANEGALSDAEHFYLPIALLIHNKLLASEDGPAFASALEESLQKASVVGGQDFHSLLRPLISGSFDVDRIDYIQRDGRNCGVNIGSIEWRRILHKLLPCLAEHTGGNGEPQNVVLLTSTKNQHVLDDFIFRLFQMYTQVYLHPKIVGLEYFLQQKIMEKAGDGEEVVLSFPTLCRLTDEKLRDLICEEWKIQEVEDALMRRPYTEFEVVSATRGSDLEKACQKNRFKLIENLARPMIKESMGVFLYSHARSLTGQEVWLTPWRKNSPIADQFHSVKYAPNFWVRRV